MPPHSTCNYATVFGNNNTSTSFFCGASPPANKVPVDLEETSNESSASSLSYSHVQAQQEQVHQTFHAQRQRQRPRYRVKFVEEVDIFEIPNARELPQSQLSQMYMSKEEMAKIHTEAWEIVELMNLGIEYEEQESFSKRGLVDLKDDCIERRKRMRERAYKVVFGAQAFRMQNPLRSAPSAGSEASGVVEHSSYYSTQIMADLYHQVSAPASSIARQVAMYDAVAASTSEQVVY